MWILDLLGENMTTKRFQYSAEKIGNDWSIEITDKETKEPFDVGYIEINDVYSQTLDNVEFIVELLNQLHEENIQLKSTMKEVTELLEEEVDLFSDKAVEHDINAYVELREFDNKDAYYMATSTKKAIKMLKEDLDDCETI